LTSYKLILKKVFLLYKVVVSKVKSTYLDYNYTCGYYPVGVTLGLVVSLGKSYYLGLDYGLVNNTGKE